MRISALFATAVICAPVEADEIWVSNEKDDTLSVISGCQKTP